MNILRNFEFYIFNSITLTSTFQICSLFKEILWTKTLRTADLNCCEPCKPWLQDFQLAIGRSIKQWPLIEMVFQSRASVFSFFEFFSKYWPAFKRVGRHFLALTLPSTYFLNWRKYLSSLNLSFLLKNWIQRPLTPFPSAHEIIPSN